ncbi:unnamed protein product [Cuscuta epithymum]|uniref:Hyccin n=1 Tax=Cuscuta epithymum TaxID=186058 RepID=A0AAV0F3G8_9ASTE|nr:unnamed protein product [Cuscuta epithymum]
MSTDSPTPEESSSASAAAGKQEDIPAGGKKEVSPRATVPRRPHISWSDSYTKANAAIEALSSIVSHVPPSLTSSETPALSLLHDPEIAAQISDLLRQPGSSAGDNHLCRWLYDTFHSSGEPDLHLVVLRFLPIISGVYLSRIALHQPLAGFEAILLALYAHETVARNGNAVTVTIPDLSHSSIYHETKQAAKASATELALAVISPSLEPCGSVRSTKRARIVGVALELFYNKISQMPLQSKLDFCEFCKAWAGGNKDSDESNGEKRDERRVNLSREILQPALRILGHCLMGTEKSVELKTAAREACRCLYDRALHDISPKDILATGSLLKLASSSSHYNREVDYTEIKFTNKITL